MTAYWFRPKRYGYGATPVTWQGWVFTVGMALAMVAVSVVLGLTGRRDWTLAAMLAVDALGIMTLFVVCRRKTDGEWRWRWGDR